MDSYIALIVDDEPESRNGLKQMIDWRELGISIVLEASHGKEALEMAMEYKPDLIFTDLMMAHMNGLEFMKELERCRIGWKVIVVTGYNDFNFAREALRLGAVDYILKPFRAGEVLPVVNQCMEELRLTRLESLRKRQEQEKYAEALALLQDKIAMEIVTGQLKHEGKIRSKLHQVSLSWMTELPLTVATIEVDNLHARLARDKELLLFAIGNVAKDTTANQVPYHLFNHHSDRWTLILGTGNPDKLRHIGDKLIRNISQYVKQAVTIGVGPACRSDGLAQSTIASMEALEYKAILGGNQVLFSVEVDLHPQRGTTPLQDSPLEQEMLSILKTGSLLNQEDFRQKLVQLLRTWGEYKKDSIHQRLFEWLLKIERQLQSHHPGLKVITDDTLKHWRHFSQFDTFEAILDNGLSLLTQMARQMHKEQNQHLGHITRRALEIMKEKCSSNELTLGQVAEEVYVSSVWLSHLLKEKTGKTFLEIVTEHRIQKAKTLLNDVSLKAYEVAELVGYKDTDYFTKQFKKHTGMTPTEYRSQF
ncbi:MAG: DNA-binding response regulator [Paenibacillus sp.]|jgi:two-component system response regulator YesN|nr:DNA-binding response regulator [Paenibacillus sp.]